MSKESGIPLVILLTALIGAGVLLTTVAALRTLGGI